MMKASHHGWLDGMAMAASGLCLLHCLALPLAIAMLPIAADLAGATEPLHLWILIAALPTSLYALGAGALRSHKSVALAGGIVALALLFLGLWLEDAPSVGTSLTVAGSLLLAFSHILNWRMRQQS